MQCMWELNKDLWPRNANANAKQCKCNACEYSFPGHLRKQGHHFVKLYTLFCCIIGAHDTDRRGNGLTLKKRESCGLSCIKLHCEQIRKTRARAEAVNGVVSVIIPEC